MFMLQLVRHISVCRSSAAAFCRAFVVLVVATKPETRLVASLGSAVEPLVSSPQPVQAARVSRVGVRNDGVFEDEGAHAGRLTDERRGHDSLACTGRCPCTVRPPIGL